MPIWALRFIDALPVMVNFQDPAEVAQDFGASSFLVWLCSPKSHWTHHDSAALLVRLSAITDGVYMWVFTNQHLIWYHMAPLLHSDGSSSFLSNSSSMSSEGVASTGGQYGFVRVNAFVEFRAPDEPLADFLIG